MLHWTWGNARSLPLWSWLLRCGAFAQRSENASLHRSTGERLPCLTSGRGFARARLSGCLVGQSGLRPSGRLRWAALAEGSSGNRPHLWAGCSTERFGGEPLHRAEGTTRAEGVTASSWPPVAVMDGDGCIEASRSFAPVSGLHRPTTRTPGFTCPPRGVLATLGTPRPGNQRPHHLKALAHVRGSGLWLLKLGRRHLGSRLGAPGRWWVWCRSAPQTTAAARPGRPGTPCPSGFQLGGEGDA
jgi:hypothetical protein